MLSVVSQPMKSMQAMHIGRIGSREAVPKKNNAKVHRAQ